MIYYGFWCCKYSNGTTVQRRSSLACRSDKQKRFTHNAVEKTEAFSLPLSHTSPSDTRTEYSVAVFAYDVPVSQSKYNIQWFFVCPFVCYCCLRVMLFSRCLDRIKHSYTHIHIYTYMHEHTSSQTEAEKGIGFIYL